jgi:hypothetical protein
MKEKTGKILAVVLSAALMLSSAPAVYADSELLSAASATAADGYYKIGTILDGRSLDAEGGGTGDGTNVQVYAPNGTAAQIWHVTQSNGIYTISSYPSGKVLDVSGGFSDDGTNIQLWSANGSAAQQWKIENDLGYCRFVNVGSGKALTISGSNAQLGSVDSENDQRFLMTEIKIGSTGFSVSDLTQAYSYTGSAVEPAAEISAETVLRSDTAAVESNPGHYITGGLDIPQIYANGYLCGPTDTAMVMTYLRGVYTSPAEITANWPDLLQNLAYLLPKAAAYYGVGNVSISGPNEGVGCTADINRVIAALQNGQPVISLQQNGGMFTYGDHYIVLRGVTQDGMFLVNNSDGQMQRPDADLTLHYDSSVYENTLYSAQQIMANCSEFYIFDAKSANAVYTNTVSLGSASDAVYKVTYSDNVQPGIASMTVTDMGNASETVVKKFAIVDRNLQPEDGGIYALYAGTNATKAVDVSGGSKEDRANVQIYDANETNAQYWIFLKNPDGTWRIENLSSGLELELAGGGVEENTNVQQYHSNGTEAQKWNLNRNEDGSYTFISAKAGKALDIAYAGMTDGTNVQIHTPNGTPAQQFYLDYTGMDTVSDTRYTVKSALAGGRVLDISNGSTENGANVQLWDANGSNAQKFMIQYSGNGYCRIVNAGSGKVLDVWNGEAVSGNNVQQYEWNGSAAQLWKADPNDDGSIVFRSALNENLVLDVAGGTDAAGANLQIYEANGSAAQNWMIE